MNQLLNAIIIGHLLTLIAILLNFVEHKKIGIACAIIGLAIAYLKEMLEVMDVYTKQSSFVLFVACAICVFASYMIWLF